MAASPSTSTDDMVSAVNAFMSTTVQCAVPQSQVRSGLDDGLYRLHTIFAAVDRRDRVYDLDPAIAKQRVKFESEIADLEKQLRGIDKAIEAAGGAELKTIKARVAELKKGGEASLNYVPEHGYHSQIVKQSNIEKWVQLELPESARFTKVRLRACYDDFAGIRGGFGFPVRFKVEVSDDPKFAKNVRMIADRTQRDVPNPALAPMDLPGGEGRYIRVTATKLAERRNDYIFALAEVELLNDGETNLSRGAKVTAKDSIEAPNRWRRTNLVDGKFTTGGNPKDAAALAAIQQKLTAILTRVETPERLKKRGALRKQRDQKKKQLGGLPAGKMVYTLTTDFKLVADPDQGKPRTIHLLHRGDLHLRRRNDARSSRALGRGVSEFAGKPG